MVHLNGTCVKSSMVSCFVHGIQMIMVPGVYPFLGYCDMNTDGGGTI